MDEALKDIANLQIGQELGRLAEELQRAIQIGTNAAAARGNLNPAFRIDIEVEYASKFASVISDTWIELFEGKYDGKLTREQVDFVKKEIATVLDARKSNSANFPGFPQSASGAFQGEIARRLESVKASACTAVEVRFRKQEAGVSTRKPHPPGTHIAIGNAANVNFGQQTGQIVSTLNLLSAQSDESKQLSEAIKTLSAVVTRSQELSEESRKQALDVISELANQALVNSQDRQPSVIKALFLGLGAILGTSADAMTVWTTSTPLFKAFFGFN